MKELNERDYYDFNFIISNNKFKANIKKERHHSTMNWCLSKLNIPFEQR